MTSVERIESARRAISLPSDMEAFDWFSLKLPEGGVAWQLSPLPTWVAGEDDPPYSGGEEALFNRIVRAIRSDCGVAGCDPINRGEYTPQKGGVQ